MFVRAKKSGAYQYLQLVHNQRVDGKVRQQVVATVGRRDVLQETGQMDGLSRCPWINRRGLLRLPCVVRKT